MDGIKGRLNDSLQSKLSFALALAILAAALLGGAFSFLSAFDEAHELQDDVLRQVAQLMDRGHLNAVGAAPAPRSADADEEARVIVQRLDGGQPAALAFPPSLPDGLHTLDAGGKTYRVLARTTASGERIAVAQEARFRNEIARDGALRTVMPLLVLMPLLLLVVARLVRGMFRPIAALSREIDQRAEQALHPVDADHVPAEVRPFVVAINRLLGRVDGAMDAQRRFVADAAHELRSPLTAMSLQAERLADAGMSDIARERLAALREGIERGRGLLEQLLALAKAQAPAGSPREPVSVQAIYRRVLEDLMPLADARRIDIGVEGKEDALVTVGEADLLALVRNLVDNAIRYTPEGGRVDLSVHAAGGLTVLRIRDNGPGIAPAERARVFDRFYRVLGSGQTGSGLGLSIVQAIAARTGADIRLDYADAARRQGLCAEIVFITPAAG